MLCAAFVVNVAGESGKSLFCHQAAKEMSSAVMHFTSALFLELMPEVTLRRIRAENRFLPLVG